MTIIIIAFSSNPFFTHSTSILNGTNQINISMAKCGLSWWKMTCKEELKLTRTCLKSVEVKGGEKKNQIWPMAKIIYFICFFKYGHASIWCFVAQLCSIRKNIFWLLCTKAISPQSAYYTILDYYYLLMVF